MGHPLQVKCDHLTSGCIHSIDEDLSMGTPVRESMGHPLKMRSNHPTQANSGLEWGTRQGIFPARCALRAG